MVHEKNVMNDAKILTVNMVRDNDLLRHEFAIDDVVKSGLGVYMLKFVPRYARTFVWRAKFILSRLMR